MYCYYYSRQTGLWSHKFYNSTSCVHAVTVCAGEVNMEDYWELISCWFTPDLQLNNCRPSACWPIDRRRRAHIKDVAVVEPQAALCRRKVRRRRQILSVGANATPSTTKVWLIASGACWAAAGGGATDRCPSTDLPQSTLVSHRSQAHRFHTLHCGNAAYRILSISTEFHKTHAGNTRSWNLYHKLAQKIWRKFTTVSCTITTGRPITLNDSCHVLDSFCPGMELCSIACKKLYRKKIVQHWPTHVQVSSTRRLAHVPGTSFLSLSPASVGNILVCNSRWRIQYFRVQIQIFRCALRRQTFITFN